MKQNHSDSVSFNSPVFRSLIRENPAAAQCLLYFCQHMDNDNSLACPYEILLRVCQNNPAKVTQAIETLTSKGLISAIETGEIPIYIVNKDFATIK